MEKRYVRKNGEAVWVNLTVALLREADGRPRPFISVIEDNSAQKLAAMTQRASEERFRAAVQAVNGVVWTNKRGRGNGRRATRLGGADRSKPG